MAEAAEAATDLVAAEAVEADAGRAVEAEAVGVAATGANRAGKLLELVVAKLTPQQFDCAEDPRTRSHDCERCAKCVRHFCCWLLNSPGSVFQESS